MYYYFFPSPGLLEKVALVVSFVGRESWKHRTLACWDSGKSGVDSWGWQLSQGPSCSGDCVLTPKVEWLEGDLGLWMVTRDHLEAHGALQYSHVLLLTLSWPFPASAGVCFSPRPFLSWSVTDPSTQPNCPKTITSQTQRDRNTIWSICLISEMIKLRPERRKIHPVVISPAETWPQPAQF